MPISVSGVKNGSTGPRRLQINCMHDMALVPAMYVPVLHHALGSTTLGFTRNMWVHNLVHFSYFVLQIYF